MLHRTIFTIFLLAAMGPRGGEAARVEKPAGADAHADEILKQTRAALGGEAALKNIRSLLASGSFIVGFGEHRASGPFKLDWLLPAMFMRSLKWNPTKEMQITTTEVVNGVKVWTASNASRASAMEGVSVGGVGMGRGGHGGSRRGGGGGSGGSGGETRGSGEAPQLRDDADSPEFEAQMRADVNCLLIALFFDGKDFPPGEFVYTGHLNIGNIKTDVLRINAADGTAYTLAIDQSSHRPIMVEYQAAKSVAPGSAPFHTTYGAIKDGSSGIQGANPVAGSTDIQIYFSDYRPVQEKGIGNVWLPHQINKSVDGNPVEDFRIEAFKLNPPLKPEQFEKNR